MITTDPTTQVRIVRQMQLARIEQAANHRLVRSAVRASSSGHRQRRRWRLPTAQRITVVPASRVLDGGSDNVGLVARWAWE